MAAAKLAPNYVEILGPTNAPREGGFLVDGLVPDSGLLGIHGTAKSGRTSLTVQIVRALRNGSGLLGKAGTERLDRVVIFATNPWAAKRHYDAFLQDAGVQVVQFTVPMATDPGPWENARRTAEAFEADYVAIDAMPMCLPEQVPTVKAELDLFRVPVLGVFVGFGGTQSVRPDDWRSEFSGGVHLASAKDVTTALNVYGPELSPYEIRVDWRPADRVFVAVDGNGQPILQPQAPLTAENVRELATLARYLPGGNSTDLRVSNMLTQVGDAVAGICGRSVTQSEITQAIKLHPTDWSAGIERRPAQPLPDEPPF